MEDFLGILSENDNRKIEKWRRKGLPGRSRKDILPRLIMGYGNHYFHNRFFIEHEKLENHYVLALKREAHKDVHMDPRYVDMTLKRYIDDEWFYVRVLADAIAHFMDDWRITNSHFEQVVLDFVGASEFDITHHVNEKPVFDTGSEYMNNWVSDTIFEKKLFEELKNSKTAVGGRTEYEKIGFPDLNEFYLLWIEKVLGEALKDNILSILKRGHLSLNDAIGPLSRDRYEEIRRYIDRINCRIELKNRPIKIIAPTASSKGYGNYKNHCWCCGHPIDGARDMLCPRCGKFYICSYCGVCKCRYIHRVKK